MTTLHDQLADLADDAPAGGPLPGLWAQGVRRQRRRRTARLGAVAAAVVVLATLATVLRPTSAPDPEPVQVPFGELHLPRAVYPPDPWADGTDESGAPGPLAVVSTATRREAVGLRGTRQFRSAFGVSAVDGAAVFLDLEGGRNGLLSGTSLTLSPDGTKVGYVRSDDDGKAVGFGVYDTVSGKTVLLDDPAAPLITVWSDSLEFSGDSRYLETSYAPEGSGGRRDHALVVWDVATGRPTVAEPAGRYWLPVMGRSPSGIVWARGSQILRFDPRTGDTTSVPTTFEAFQTSYGPGAQAFAAIAPGANAQEDWRLLVGSSPAEAREVSLGIHPDLLLGWRDADHVVVGQVPDRRAVEVDLATGRSTAVPLETTEREDDLVTYAADLWANPLVDGVRPPDARDPRTPWWIGGGLGLAALLAGGVLALLRRRRARP
ncbi:MAG TPA: hypothetical protein VNS46_17425 [Nocardioides sp.]|nr:hypothetical protein [Nocardioides sp.]